MLGYVCVTGLAPFLGLKNINFTYSCFLRKVEWTKVENWPICGNLQKTLNFLRTLVASLFVHTNQHLSTDLRATITAAAKFLRWLPEQGKFQFCTNTTQIFTAYIVHHTVKLLTFPSSPNMHLFIWGFVLLQFLAIHLSIFWLSWNNGGEKYLFFAKYIHQNRIIINTYWTNIICSKIWMKIICMTKLLVRVK